MNGKLFMATSPNQLTDPDALAKELLAAFDQIFGLHPGFRPAHAKGAICSGVFTPSPAAIKLTNAPHATRASTPIHLRFSDSTGIPQIPDNDANASPRGMGVRFNLAPHVHTDLVAHSTEGFPTRTADEFLKFLEAAMASGPTAAKPTPVEQFLGAHPKALEFVMAPKPFPTSFARESYFCVSAFKFTNAQGVSRFGRYKILPVAGNEYLSAEDASKKSANFLFDELADRLGKGPIEFKIVIQLADPGDETADATVHWPASREQIDFGIISLTKLEDANEPELRKIIFDPRPLVQGIEASADPLFAVRAAIYIMSGRRRRAAQ
jgi:catalase